MSSVSSKQIINRNYVKIVVNGLTVTALLDTGAARTLISKELSLKMQVAPEKVEPDELKNLYTADGSRMPISSKTTLCMQINELTVMTEAYIVNRLVHDLILGMDFFDQTDAKLDFRKRRVTFSDCPSVLPVYRDQYRCMSDPADLAVAAATVYTGVLGNGLRYKNTTALQRAVDASRTDLSISVQTAGLC